MSRSEPWPETPDPLTGHREPRRLSQVMRALEKIARPEIEPRQIWRAACDIYFPARLAEVRFSRKTHRLRGRAGALRSMPVTVRSDGPLDELRRLERAVHSTPEAWLKAWVGVSHGTQDRVSEFLPPLRDRRRGPGYSGEGLSVIAPAQTEARVAVQQAMSVLPTSGLRRGPDPDLEEVFAGIATAYRQVTGKPIGYTVKRSPEFTGLVGSSVDLVRTVEVIFGVSLIGHASSVKRLRRHRRATENRLSGG